MLSHQPVPPSALPLEGARRSAMIIMIYAGDYGLYGFEMKITDGQAWQLPVSTLCLMLAIWPTLASAEVR